MERLRKLLRPEAVIITMGLVIILLVGFNWLLMESAFEQIAAPDSGIGTELRVELLQDREALLRYSVGVILFVVAMFVGLALLWIRSRRAAEELNHALERMVEKRTAQLEHERNLLRTLIDNVPDFIYAKDMQSRFILANRAVAAFLGAAEPSALLGKTDFDFFPAPLAQKFRDDELALMQQGTSIFGKQEPFTMTDGRVGWNWTTKVPLRDSQNQVIGLVGVGRDMTELRAKDALLRQREELYRSVVEVMPMALVRKDRDGRILYGNSRFWEALGRPEQEALGKTTAELAPPALAEKFQQQDREVLERGVTLDVVEEYQGQDNQIQMARVLKSPIRDENGAIVGVQVMFWDITEGRRQYEQVRKLSRAVEASPTSIVITDVDGNIEYVNSAFSQVTGYSPDEALGKNPRILKSGYTTPQEYAVLWNTIRAGQVWQGEFLNRRKDGGVYWETASISPIMNDEGAVTHFVAVKQDITQRKAMENQLRESERMLAKAQEIAHVGSWRWDLKSDRVEWSDEMFRIFGIARAEFGGTVASVVETAIHPADRARLLDANARAHAGIATPLQYRVVHRDGQERVVWAEGEVEFDADGKPLSLVGVVQDITERKRAEDDLRRQNEFLDALHETTINLMGRLDLQELLHVITHRAATLIGTQHGYIYLHEPGATEMLMSVGLGLFQQMVGTAAHRGAGATGIVWNSGELLVIRDYQEWPQRLNKTGTTEIHSLVCMPLKSGETVVGVFGLAHTDPNLHFDDTTIQVLTRFSHLASIALDNARLYLAAQTELAERAQAEERFRTLFAASPDAILVLDPNQPEWPIVDCNQVTCEMNGYTREELIGASIDLLNVTRGNPAERAAYLEEIRRVGVLRVEAEHRHKDGHLFTIETSTSLFQVGDRELVLGIDRDVTERKRVENALRESERLMRKAQQIAHIGSWSYDYRTNHMYWSEEMSRVVGIAPQTQEGDPRALMARVVHEDDLETFGAAFSDETLRALPSALEFRIRRGQDAIVHLWGEAEIIYDEEANPLNLVGFVQDITERKNAEQDLRNNRAQLASLMNNTNDLILSIDRDLQLTIFNDPFKQLVENGLGKPVYVGAPIFDYVEPHTIPTHTHFYERAFAGEHCRYEIEYNASNDVTLYFETYLNPIYGEQNQVVGLAIFTRDITERKLAEQALTQQKELLQTVFDNIPVMIGLFDAQGKYTLINQEWSHTLGYTLNEMNDGDVMAALYPEPDQRLAARSFMFAPTHGWRDFKTQVRAGHDIDTSWAYTPLSNGMTLAFGQDITERKKVERLKNEFILTVSHELRTPLTSIRGSLGLIAGGVAGEIPERAKNMIDIAYKNSERLVRLINDILDIEKIESGKMVFQFKPTELLPLLEHAIDANRAYGEQYQIAFVIAGAPNDAKVNVDADRMIQVLTNLLSNAAKFSPPHSTVEISARRVGRDIRVAVHDQGTGIPLEFQERIFQKFAQADSSDTRQKGGTGLGLSIAKAIVEKHNGAIGFESRDGMGTTFYFQIPEYQTVTVPHKSEMVKPRVLIVEDDRDVAMLLRLMLKHGGFESDVANDALRALELLHTQRYAAVTLDLMLPDKDGISLIRELRAQEDTRDIPIVVVSAKAEQGRQQLNGDAMWVADWLQKPIDQQQLVRAIAHASQRLRHDKPHILHVEDDLDVQQVVRAILQDTADVTAANDVAQARLRLEQDEYDLVILDPMLPDGSGTDLIGLLRRNNAQIPVVIFSASEEEAYTLSQVNAALVKSRTSNEQLLSTITQLITPDQVPFNGGGE